MSDDKMTLFELKEKAKWSTDPEEKKAAIKELSTRGENAISELQEIMNITAYEDIRNACADAIKSMQARKSVEVNETSSTANIDRSSGSSSNSAAAADVVVATKDQKKEKSKRKKSKARERPLNQSS
jgi:hypothetical protein